MCNSPHSNFYLWAMRWKLNIICYNANFKICIIGEKQRKNEFLFVYIQEKEALPPSSFPKWEKIFCSLEMDENNPVFSL